MRLISEVLERVLEMKLSEKRVDMMEGKFIVTEILKNEFTKNMQLKSQHTGKAIKNLSGEILQEISCDAEFKLNKAGDIVGSEFISDHGTDSVETLNYYDKEKRLVQSITKTRRSYEDNILIPCTVREGYVYDEQSRLSIFVSDTLHEDTHKEKDEYIYFMFEYTDENLLAAINVIRTIPSNHDHQTERYTINYGSHDFIEYIHRIDSEDICDEFYEYYEDGGVHVFRNMYDDNKTVVGKAEALFRRIV